MQLIYHLKQKYISSFQLSLQPLNTFSLEIRTGIRGKKSYMDQHKISWFLAKKDYKVFLSTLVINISVSVDFHLCNINSLRNPLLSLQSLDISRHLPRCFSTKIPLFSCTVFPACVKGYSLIERPLGRKRRVVIRGRNVFVYWTRLKFELISISPVSGHFSLPLVGYPGYAEFTLNPVCQNNIFKEVSSSHTPCHYWFSAESLYSSPFLMLLQAVVNSDDGEYVEVPISWHWAASV